MPIKKPTDTYADGYADAASAEGNKGLPTDATEIDAEIVVLEKRLAMLRAAQQTGVKQEFPRWVYKGGGDEAVATTLVASQDELDKLGDGWGEKADCDKKTADHYKKKGA